MAQPSEALSAKLLRALTVDLQSAALTWMDLHPVACIVPEPSAKSVRLFSSVEVDRLQRDFIVSDAIVGEIVTDSAAVSVEHVHAADQSALETQLDPLSNSRALFALAPGGALISVESLVRGVMGGRPALLRQYGRGCCPIFTNSQPGLVYAIGKQQYRKDGKNHQREEERLHL